MDFQYVNPDNIIRIIPPTRGKVSGARREFLEGLVYHFSLKLTAWYPNLPAVWKSSQEESQIRNLLEVMLSEAVLRAFMNPELMSSETIGPFAYSKFDSDDWVKQQFSKESLTRLEALLGVTGGPGIISVNSYPSTGGVFAPITKAGWRSANRYTYYARGRRVR